MAALTESNYSFSPAGIFATCPDCSHHLATQKNADKQMGQEPSDISNFTGQITCTKQSTRRQIGFSYTYETPKVTVTYASPVQMVLCPHVHI
jgi:hypothetical protein